MRLKLLFPCLAALLCSVSTAIAAPPAAKTVKIVLTKIDATQVDGLILARTTEALKLMNLSGATATSFKTDASSLSAKPIVSVQYTVKKRKRVYLSAHQIWKLTDNAGEGVEVTDNVLRTLIIVSNVGQPIEFLDSGYTYTVPGHSFVLINNPSNSAVLDYGSSGWLGFDGDYREKMSPILRPTEVVISPSDSGIKNGFPAIVEDSHCDQTILMNGS